MNGAGEDIHMHTHSIHLSEQLETAVLQNKAAALLLWWI